MRFIVFAILLFSFFNIQAQYSFSCIIKDAAAKNSLHGVTASVDGTEKAASSDSSGKVFFNSVAAGAIKITFSFVGYKSQTINFKIPQLNNASPIIFLERDADKTEEAVIVTSSRTNSRIEDLPTKVEVLGSEEVGEENGIKPGNITSLLGDIAGIQIQQSSATTGNADARVQGLPGKYIQILRDGLPLFGGYSGGFSILQIPPADLKQIEIIKGASSTLYGGGAIAGMINLVSKSPKLNSPERAITINQSTLNESNFNAYFSNRKKKTGYTFFTGATYQRAADVNKDGFSDVPDLTTIFFHPKLFFFPNTKQTATLGYNLTYEDRNGGDMQVLHKTADAQHQFFIKSKSLRNTIDGRWENKLNANGLLIIKGTASFYDRNINTNVFGMKAKQLSFYTEISYFKKSGKHSIVNGINLSGENFRKHLPDSSIFTNYNYNTAGIFFQDDWAITPRFVAEGGVRLDYHTAYGSFILPRIALLYKINTNVTTRLGYGNGYKIPSLFSNDIDERDYFNVISGNSMAAERSTGTNWDINYKTAVNGWRFTINQMFYITEIKNPLVQQKQPAGVINFYSAAEPVNTKGVETYIAGRQDELEIYLGYTYTVARQLYDPVHSNISLSARNKLATVISYEFTDAFRLGWETAYTGKQYLDNGNTTPGYVFAAAMIRYDIRHISFVLNCENLFDYRQTRKETIFSGSSLNPVFKQIWAPLDGRVINLSAKISW